MRPCLHLFRALLALLSLASPFLAHAAPTTARVSVANDGTAANSGCASPKMSAGGRFLVFSSWATNLVPNDTNGKADVFLRDTVSGATKCVSLATDGSFGNGNSGQAGLDVSADGRYVVFASDATNLVPGDTNGRLDVFLRDTVANTTTLVSVGTDGARGNGNSFGPSVSADGRYVAFQSMSSTFAPGVKVLMGAVYLRDTVAGTTSLVSVGDDGTPWPGSEPSLSADGSKVAFTCAIDGVTPDDANRQPDVFVRDLAAGTTALVSRGDAGPGNRPSRHPALSGDGKRVAFFSFANNLTSGAGGMGDVYVRDLSAGTTSLVSGTSTGAAGNGPSGLDGVAISRAGRYVAFASRATNLVPGDVNGQADIFVRDTVSESMARVSCASDGTPAETESLGAALSGDGRYAAFVTASSNIGPPRSGTNMDVYLRGPLTDTPEPLVRLSAAPVLRPMAVRSERQAPPPYAGGVQLVRDANSGRVVWLQAPPAPSATALLSAHAADLGLSDPATEMRPYREETDGEGVTHTHYAQEYKGLPVIGGGAVVHAGGGKPDRISAGLSPRITLDTTPRIPKEAAEEAARRAFFQQYPQAGVPKVFSTTLVVYDRALVENRPGQEARLAWQVNVQDDHCPECQPNEDEDYYLDAADGSLLGSQSRVRHLFRRIYDCTPRSWGDSSCWMNGQFADHYPNYIFGRSEIRPPRGPNPVFGGTDVDTLFDRFGDAHNYYYQTFGRDGMNGLGGTGTGTADYPIDKTAGFVYYNAVPSSFCPNAAFLGGVVYFCQGWVTLDIVGHECSHGLPFFVFNPGIFTGAIDYPGGMIPDGEAGTLDESLSDVMGEAIERFATGTTDWVNAMGFVRGDLPRSLEDPPNSASRPHPDRLYSPYYVCSDIGDPIHVNSTVSSKAFYLMSEGDSFNGCSIRGIGFDKAQQILYRAVTLYYVPSETFNQAYIAIQQAASDLFSDDDCWQVKKALQAVEMDQQGRCSGGVERAAYAAVPFTVSDMGRALQIAGGLTAARPEDLGRLDVALSGNSFLKVDMRDALSISRKVAGLEMNP